MKVLRSAYVSACVTPALKERLEAIASSEERSLSQVAGWAIDEGILLVEREVNKRMTPPEELAAGEKSPYMNTEEFLKKKPYDSKKIAAQERRVKNKVQRILKERAAPESKNSKNSKP